MFVLSAMQNVEVPKAACQCQGHGAVLCQPGHLYLVMWPFYRVTECLTLTLLKSSLFFLGMLVLAVHIIHKAVFEIRLMSLHPSL